MNMYAWRGAAMRCTEAMVTTAQTKDSKRAANPTQEDISLGRCQHTYTARNTPYCVSGVVRVVTRTPHGGATGEVLNGSCSTATHPLVAPSPAALDNKTIMLQ